MTPEEALRLCGTAEPVPPAVPLRAGPLTLVLQRGRLRHIRCGGREVWHGLGFVLRDPDWGTPEPVIERVDLRGTETSFEAHIEGHFPVAPPLPFRLRVEGTAEGRLHFEAEAVPAADLQVNRIGLCLMHPLQACGARVQVGHVDGRVSESTFPTSIPPWPPFMLVRALRHEWAPGAWAEAVLEGDTFETEDQRNNADASFKTYSRSNMAPRPYRLGAGVAIRQSATLWVEGEAALEVPPPLRVTVGPPAGALPPVGIEIHAADATRPALREALRELQPAHLHLAWRPGLEVHWPGIAEMLLAANAGLRLDLVTADEAPVRLLKAQLDVAGITPEAVAIFPSHAANVVRAKRVFAGTPVGGGSPHFFVQLSRLDDLGPVDFASFTTASVVHGADDDDVMLGLASLSAMVATWRARHPHLPLRVGPSAIAARASPLGAQPASDGTRRLALAASDPRDRAPFGAAWALGHVAAWADAGVQAMTLLSLTGAAGVVGRPSFELLARLGRPAERLAVQVSEPRRVAALALQRHGRKTLLLANLTPESQTVALPVGPHELPPYATAAIDLP